MRPDGTSGNDRDLINYLSDQLSQIKVKKTPHEFQFQTSEYSVHLVFKVQNEWKFYLRSVTCALGFVIWTVQEVWAGAVSPGGESASNPLSNNRTKKTNVKCTIKLIINR